MTSKKTASLMPRLLTVLLLVVLAVAAWWWLSRPKPIQVVLQEVEIGKVEASIANTRAGAVESCQRAKLSTLLGGRITQLPIKEGDKVKKGQLLMQLWNEDQQAQNALARTQVDTARQGINEACSLAANAEREARRLDLLQARGYASSSQREKVQAEAEARRASCDAAKSRVSQAMAQVHVTQVERGRTTLYAPFDGTIARIVGEVGEYSTPSPPGIATPPAIDLFDESCLYIKAPMDEVDSPKIHVGQPVRITLDALPKQSFAGQIKRVAPYVLAVERQSRTVDVEAVFENPEEFARLLVGYSANLEVILAVHENTLRIPTSALQEGDRVLVAAASGRLEERRVKTGLANWEYTEILEGLQAGERVVTSLEREGVVAGVLYAAENAPANASTSAANGAASNATDANTK